MLTNAFFNAIVLLRGDKMNVPDRIKSLRKSLNLSQEDFGNRLGVSRSVIANIECDRLKRPDQKEPIYKLICEKFNINEEWLKYGTEPKFKTDGDDFTKIVVAIDRGDPKAREAILNYWKLSEEDKALVWSFLDRFAK